MSDEGSDHKAERTLGQRLKETYKAKLTANETLKSLAAHSLMEPFYDDSSLEFKNWPEILMCKAEGGESSIQTTFNIRKQFPLEISELESHPRGKGNYILANELEKFMKKIFAAFEKKGAGSKMKHFCRENGLKYKSELVAETIMVTVSWK